MLKKELLEKAINKKRGHHLFRLAKRAEELKKEKDRMFGRMVSKWDAANKKAINENAGMPIGSRALDGFGIVARLELDGFRHAIVADAGLIVAENNRVLDAENLPERISHAVDGALARVLRKSPCPEVGDELLHRKDAKAIAENMIRFMGDMRRGGLVITRESLGEYVNATTRVLACLVEIRCGFLHAAILARALGAELTCLDELAGRPFLDGMGNVAVGPEAAMAAERLRVKDEIVLAELLLEVFYPGEAQERLGALFPERCVSGNPGQKRVDCLADRVKAIIDANDEELNEYRNEFGGDAEKIARAISISRAGASKKLAVFAVEKSLDDGEISFMIDAEGLLCHSWAACEQVHEALKGLSTENRESILGTRKALERAAGWLALMPNYMRETPLLAFLLGLHFDVPEDKASAHSFLVEHRAELDEAMLLNDLGLERLESDAVAFVEYLRRFDKPEKKAEGQSNVEAPDPASRARPYESLTFSTKAEEAMVAEGTDPLDIRIALVCGLRLNSTKGARGKAYFNTAVFRKNVERDLREERKRLGLNGGDRVQISERREAAERFLTRHGVLSFYKSGREVVRLNMGGCGTNSDALGDEIIADTVKWMMEFKKETSV